MNYICCIFLKFNDGFDEYFLFLVKIRWCFFFECFLFVNVVGCICDENVECFDRIVILLGGFELRISGLLFLLYSFLILLLFDELLFLEVNCCNSL